MLTALWKALQTPEPYAAGDGPFWNHPHIAAQMLRYHLDPDNDAASYRPEAIDAVCRFLGDALRLAPDSQLLDLGCGPGLYTTRFAKAGMRVTGVDLSENSIAYAKEQAARNHQEIEYILADYREPLRLIDAYDAAMMVSCDYGVMGGTDRGKVLQNIRRALKPGGLFAIDVTSAAKWDTLCEDTSWQCYDTGFWRPHPHAVLEKKIKYPQEYADCDLYVVCDHEVTAYRIYQTYFTAERITQELQEAGFAVKGLYNDLMGNPYHAGGETIGVLCVKTEKMI